MGQALPPVDPSALIGADPVLAWGIILFDILVMNGDRHPSNIAFDTQTKEVTIFDHSHAFMTPACDVDATLANNRKQLAIGAHCLACEMNSWDGFMPWVAKIKSLPDFFVEGVIEEACKLGIPPSKQGAICDFMKLRRDGIDAIVTNTPASFPKLPAAAVT
jgi:hypothetical protein